MWMPNRFLGGGENGHESGTVRSLVLLLLSLAGPLSGHGVSGGNRLALVSLLRRTGDEHRESSNPRTPPCCSQPRAQAARPLRRQLEHGRERGRLRREEHQRRDDVPLVTGDLTCSGSS